MTRVERGIEQLRFLGAEMNRMVNRRWWRWLTIWVSPGFGAIASYRLDRAGFLLCGAAWVGLRILFFPVFLLLRLLGARCEIHYRADVGRGLHILHPTLGVVVSGEVVAGRDLLLTGGNCIGLRHRADPGTFVIGDRVELGANAVILGPLHVGNDVRVGAGAIVVHDVADGEVMIGAAAHAVGAMPAL